ncbi:MAG: hypothetical protein U9N79_09745 [Actinomycetota bacterium]|nr:hypothetical protein [Actinomycetota bacterium]
MEAANRWETEAIRESRDRRRGRPTVSQQRKAPDPDGEWRTLREASEETGIPVGTLRKWCRRESVDSYLESDGELTLRMLEMGSVRRNARELGRELDGSRQQTANSQQPELPDEDVPTTDYRLPTTAGEAGNTMIVPIDAWDKMLTQLGNLHEAGQQLAEARERAAKAETEAKFLRERLAEVRKGKSPEPADSRQPEPESQQQTADSRQPEPESQQAEPESYQPPDTRYQSPDADPRSETTSFWRYVMRGWKGRKR